MSPSTAPAHGGVPDPPALPSKKESRDDSGGAVYDKGTAGFAASTSYAARRPSKELPAAKAPEKTTARRESGGSGVRDGGHGVAAAAAKKPRVEAKAEAKAGAKTETKAVSSSATGGKPAKRRSDERGVAGAGKRPDAAGSGAKPGRAGTTREVSEARDGSKDGPLSAVLRGVTFVLSGFVNPERSEVGVLLNGFIIFSSALYMLQEAVPLIFPLFSNVCRFGTKRWRWGRIMNLDGIESAHILCLLLKAPQRQPKRADPEGRL